MKKILLLAILLITSDVANGMETGCALMFDTTMYFDEGNYRAMLFGSTIAITNATTRMAFDVQANRAKVVPSGTRVDVVSRTDDMLAVRVNGNVYYCMPDSVDCSR